MGTHDLLTVMRPSAAKLKIYAMLLTFLLASPTWAAEFAVTQCVLPTTDGATVDCTSSGFGTPKGAFLFGGYSRTNGIVEANAGIFFGAYDGTRQYSIGGAAEDAQNPTDTGAFYDVNSAFGVLAATTQTQDADCTASLITDGIRLTCADAPTFSYIANVLLIGGSGVSNVYAGQATGSATQNSAITVSDPNFQPDVILAFMHNSNSGIMHISMGMAWRNGASIVQRGMGIFDDNAASPSSVISTLSDQYMLQSGLTSTTSLEVTSIGATGFDVTTRVTGGARLFTYLAIKLNGLNAWLGTSPAPTSTGSNALTGVGFQPQVGLMLAGEHAAMNTQYLSGNGEIFGISIFTAAASDTISTWGNDGGATSDEESMTDARVCRTRKDGADFDTCTLTSFDADGMTLNYSLASAATRQRALLLIQGSVGGTVNQRWRRRQW